MDPLRQPNWHDAGLGLSWDKAEKTPDPDLFAFPIDTIVRLRAKQTPDAPAILWQDDVLSFSEFDRLVDHCAFSIMADYGDNDGLQGARLGVEVRKAPSTLVFLFAALRAGAIVVPLNPALKPDQFRHIATDCQMRAAFVSSNTAAVLNTVDKSTQWVSFTPGSAENNTRGSRQTSENPQPLPALNAQNTALLFYTSGSTGKPKGVMVSHHNNVLGAASVAHFLSLSPDDRVLTVLPLSFDYGFNQLVSTWLAGGAAVLHDFFLASDVVKAVQRYAVTGLGAVPPLWHLILGASWKDGAGDSLRYLTNSGGKLSQDLQQSMAKTFP
ncbi:MAG: AMP-binding protein, partial [Pseudomonadota bacterium]